MSVELIVGRELLGTANASARPGSDLFFPDLTEKDRSDPEIRKAAHEVSRRLSALYLAVTGAQAPSNHTQLAHHSEAIKMRKVAAIVARQLAARSKSKLFQDKTILLFTKLMLAIEKDSPGGSSV